LEGNIYNVAYSKEAIDYWKCKDELPAGVINKVNWDYRYSYERSQTLNKNFHFKTFKQNVQCWKFYETMEDETG
jgi:hypothetical protein